VVAALVAAMAGAAMVATTVVGLTAEVVVVAVMVVAALVAKKVGGLTAEAAMEATMEVATTVAAMEAADLEMAARMEVKWAFRALGRNHIESISFQTFSMLCFN